MRFILVLKTMYLQQLKGMQKSEKIGNVNENVKGLKLRTEPLCKNLF